MGRLLQSFLGIALLFFGCGPGPQQQAPRSQPQNATTPEAVDSTVAKAQALIPRLKSWNLSESVNRMDGSPEIVLSKLGSPDAVLIIRCAQHKTAAYVITPGVVNDGRVRVRFDESAPQRQSWSESSDHSSLFAPDPISFARKLTKTRTFLLEFKPFEQVPRTVEFEVSDLDVQLPKIAEACNWAAFDKARERERADAAKAKAIEEALRRRIEESVHPCKNTERYSGKWCWSDPGSDSALFRQDSAPFESKEEAIWDATRMARIGVLFQEAKK